MWACEGWLKVMLSCDTVLPHPDLQRLTIDVSYGGAWGDPLYFRHQCTTMTTILISKLSVSVLLLYCTVP